MEDRRKSWPTSLAYRISYTRGVPRMEARAWLYAIQEAFAARGRSYSAVGPNPELRALFYRLAWLSRSGVNAVFVFDGQKRPKVKRGKHVRTIPHRLADGFKQLIAGYSFHSYTAPGEAEAELAYLNICGAIDFVVTSDSDVFVFGARNIIRTGTGTPSRRVNETGKDDLDKVTVYRVAEGGGGLHEPGQFCRAQFLVIAILAGGDYDKKGVRGCGRSAAELVVTHHPELCDELLAAGKHSRGRALRDFLYDWRSRLQDILKNGRGIGRKYRKAASRLPDIFPDPTVLRLYCSPITSQSAGGLGNITYEWLERKLPDTGALAILCGKLFQWREDKTLLNRLHTHVWDGYFIRKFAQHASSTPESTQAAASIRHIWKAERRQFSRSGFCSLQLTVSILPLMQQASDAIVADNNPAPFRGSESSSYEMLVWVPEPIVRGITPNMIREFFDTKKELQCMLTPRNFYKPYLNNSVEIMLPNWDAEDEEVVGRLASVSSITLRQKVSLVSRYRAAGTIFLILSIIYSYVLHMPKSTTTTPAKGKGGRKKKVVVPGYKEAQEAVGKGVKKYAKSHNTSGSYDGHVRRGRGFIACFAPAAEAERDREWKEGDNSQHLATEEEMPTEFQEARMDPEFPNSLDGPPNKCTPLAIAMFLTHKCINEDLGKSTAEGIHAAFKRHYKLMDGDKYRGRWRYDDAKKEWTGNPVDSAAVEDMMDACKNKDGESERKHSRAISIEDMGKLYRHFLQHCPSDLPPNPAASHSEQRKLEGIRAGYLLFNALSTSAFTCWMRIGEVSSLQYKSLEFPSGSHARRKPDGDKPHHFVLNLRNRKNWQKREKNGEHQLSGHCYKIYPQLSTPEMDMYTHVLDWLDFYEHHLLGRPLEADDYIFPVLGANGASVQPKSPITPDTAQKRICAMAEAAGVRGAKDFTTHCFRRGGAQYRFMCAPQGQRWSLSRIRWWGGWAIGEHRDTLIRYLLDELYTYEADHSDALNPSLAGVKENSVDPMEAAVPGWPSNVATQYNTILTEIQTGLQTIRSFQSALHSLPSHSSIDYSQSITIPSHNPPPGGLQNHSGLYEPLLYTIAPSDQSQQVPTSSFISTQTPVHASQQHIVPVAQPTVTPTVHDGGALELKHIIPTFPNDAKHSEHWEIAVRDWEHADPSRSLYVALKDWDPQWHKRTGLSALYGQREQIAKEFITIFRNLNFGFPLSSKRDKEDFMARYPKYKQGVGPLLKQIRQARKDRGECASRNRS
ncbi:hypothetical protein D9613_008208 [Agrocybe pediades]|uniref:XPG-I domain-containing protein n=1 Tax=Agrocybe pediades TaxID=84607 RepID=A0A8H4VMN1_9AGAR|nr:hypothetical protein D9613_008208 [Agrocybe pediades]